MYHLITGRLPFPGNTPIDRLGKRISGRPVPILDLKPDLPPALVGVLDTLLATRPNDRYQTASDAADALQALIRKKSAPPTRTLREPAPASSAPLPDSPRIESLPAEHPRWFRPLASFAAASPKGALSALIAVSLALFLAGFATAMLLR
jgi:serine/threonine-protein kinase